MDMTGKLLIKVQFDNDIRRIPIHNEDITYDELILMMQRIYKGKLSAQDELSLKYKDEDGDLVTLADDSDLLFAIQCSKVLRIAIQVKGRDSCSGGGESELLTGRQLATMRVELGRIRDQVNRLLDTVCLSTSGTGHEETFGPGVEAPGMSNRSTKPGTTTHRFENGATTYGSGNKPMAAATPTSHQEFDPLNSNNPPLAGGSASEAAPISEGFAGHSATPSLPPPSSANAGGLLPQGASSGSGSGGATSSPVHLPHQQQQNKAPPGHGYEAHPQQQQQQQHPTSVGYQYPPSGQSYSVEGDAASGKGTPHATNAGYPPSGSYQPQPGSAYYATSSMHSSGAPPPQGASGSPYRPSGGTGNMAPQAQQQQQHPGSGGGYYDGTTMSSAGQPVSMSAGGPNMGYGSGAPTSAGAPMPPRGPPGPPMRPPSVGATGSLYATQPQPGGAPSMPPQNRYAPPPGAQQQQMFGNVQGNQAAPLGVGPYYSGGPQMYPPVSGNAATSVTGGGGGGGAGGMGAPGPMYPHQPPQPGFVNAGAVPGGVPRPAGY